MAKKATRREQVRVQRAKVAGTLRARFVHRVVSWPVITGTMFTAAAVAIAMFGRDAPGYSVGQRIDQPIYARAQFKVLDERQTTADRRAARAGTPSYYTVAAQALTYGRIRADLMRLYQAGADSETFEAYEKAMVELGWPVERRAYDRLRGFASDAGRAQFQGWVDELPLESEYLVRDLLGEDRDPKSAVDFVRVESKDENGVVSFKDVTHRRLIPHGNERARQGSAAAIAKRFRAPSLRPNVEFIVLAAFTDQPTILYDQARTVEEMRAAADATSPAYRIYERNKPFVTPGILGAEEYELVRAEHAAYTAFLQSDALDARVERQAQLRADVALGALVGLLCIGLLSYTRLHQARVFEVGARTVGFAVLMLGLFAVSRFIAQRWPDHVEMVFAPCLVVASILAIAYPRRFAMGVACIAVIILTLMIGRGVVFLIVLSTGVVVAVFQLDEIRSRTKLISAGGITALAIMVAAVSGGFFQRHAPDYVINHTLEAGAATLLAFFLVSGTLPLVERVFRIATSLTMLEWRDPTRPLLQLLAREAPGTYNHSLVLGTLADAACESIGANGLLAQVGALYHDVGKIPKADYFVENQEGKISRHDNLAPTMSLLIIVGHVKDGVEMAKEYKLPRVLHQFIQEHHGTTVVRYFHHVASEKQPRIASGKHDREVSEAEFRYAGPKPHSRESAVLMLCDGVEGAVRSLTEPTPTRIEGVVHSVVTDRLNDGQFSDCDITLREIHQVEESLVKSLCSIYHGRVAYPKAAKSDVAVTKPAKVSV